jgi:hypothetical protein
MTYRYVVYDIEKSLKKTFDDADITLNQILYWVMVVANKIRAQHEGIAKSDLYTATFSEVSIEEDDKGRKYIDLPVQIMDLPNNAGVVYLTYNIETNCCSGPAFAQTFFQPANVGEVQHLYLDAYTTPSPKNPYFYRIGDKHNGVDVNRLYLLGLECVDVTDLEIAVKSSLDPRKLCNLDDELPVPDEFIQDLIMEVLQLGRFVMMIPEERENTGEDEVQMQNYRTPKVPQSQNYSENQNPEAQ